jgi:hypothetical protein
VSLLLDGVILSGRCLRLTSFFLDVYVDFLETTHPQVLLPPGFLSLALAT